MTGPDRWNSRQRGWSDGQLSTDLSAKAEGLARFVDSSIGVMGL